MISRIEGKIKAKKEGMLLVDVRGISYEMFVPRAVMNTIDKEYDIGADIELITYHYFQISQSSGTPVLIGFQNEVEKEFFEKFISVSGIGPKAACRALTEPFSIIAGAVDSGDEGFLKKLPGIGQRKAAEIVAKLKGRVGKYGLIRDEYVQVTREHNDIKEEALSVLLQLQYKQQEAEDMLIKAMQRNPGIETSEDLLNEVYRARKSK